MSVLHYHDREQIPSGQLPAGVAIAAVPFAVARAGHRASH